VISSNSLADDFSISIAGGALVSCQEGGARCREDIRSGISTNVSSACQYIRLSSMGFLEKRAHLHGRG
jgi:hypothetical protein